MRAVRITGDGVEVTEVDEPEGSGVMVDVVSSSICGTDLGLVAAGLSGFTLGHEFVGTVDGVAYAIEPTIYCGSCPECRVGATQRCVGEHGNLGIFVDGGLADRARVAPTALVALPEGLGPLAGCLVEPAAVSWHGLRRAAVEPGERVVVVGGGSIGLLAVAAAVAMGHPVDLVARHPHQRAAGERLGAGTPSGHYDVVIEAAGSAGGVAEGVELARPGGRMVLLGVFWDTVPVPGPASLVKELTFTPAMAYGRHDGIREVDEAAALLAGRPEIADALITHRFSLDDAAEAFRVATDRSAGAIKVVIEP
jgi:2-desacetyl-2-hydroxyethyl bacteriochlorophyllide A dehydrogenase